jgi:hypothetical protein
MPALRTKSTSRGSLVRFEPTAKGLALTALALAQAWVALRLAPVLLVLVVALMLVGTLNPAVEWLETKKMGIPGALLALPAGAATRMLVTELRIAIPGEVAQDTELRARDERAEVKYERRAEGVPAPRAAAIALERAELRQAQQGGAARATEQPITSGEK